MAVEREGLEMSARDEVRLEAEADADDDSLVGKLVAKYERTAPGVCSVCHGRLQIDHKGGGLPLTWVCEAAKAESESMIKDGSEPESEHLDESRWLDYRKVGDARVMELARRYRLACDELRKVRQAAVA